MKVAAGLLLSGLLWSWPVLAEIVIERGASVPGGGGAGPATNPAPAAVAAPAASGPDGADVLTLQNGDRLHGTLVSATPGAGFGLKWRSVEIESPVSFSLRTLDRVRLGRQPEGGAAPPQAQVQLSNSDTLRGEIVSMEGDTLVLRTAYAGDLSLRRAMLAQVWPGRAGSSVVYEGPDDMTGWVVGEQGGRRGGWIVRDGKLVTASRYPVGRELKGLPDMAEISFTVGWEGPYMMLAVAVCAENIRSIDGNTYFFQFSGNSGYLYRRSNTSGSNNLGPNFPIELMREQAAARESRIQILLNRPAKQICLLINGALVRQWTDPDGFPGTGKGLLFQCQGEGVRHSISRIRAAAWDGRIPQSGASLQASPEDSLSMANGDKMSGKVLAIKDDVVRFETSYAPLDIPLNRISEIGFGTNGRERARLNKNDIRCEFEGGGWVTLDLVSLENGQISGKSENFGNIRLAISALRVIEFNPRAKREDDEGPGNAAELNELLAPFVMSE